MEEILIDDRLGSGAADRRRTMAWAGAVAVVLLLGLLYAKARQPTPVVAAPAGSATTTVATPEPLSLFVHVAGAVEKPGLYRFPEGTRVADAIEAAGGPAPKADLDAINLADLLTDGAKVDVPLRGRAAPAPAAASASPALVDLNEADQASLETIPGIGPVTATAILQHRAEIGAFESVEQLLDVTGIGPATLEALRPYVTV